MWDFEKSWRKWKHLNLEKMKIVKNIIQLKGPYINDVTLVGGGIKNLRKKSDVLEKKSDGWWGEVSRPMMVKAIALLINCDRDTLWVCLNFVLIFLHCNVASIRFLMFFAWRAPQAEKLRFLYWHIWFCVFYV